METGLPPTGLVEPTRDPGPRLEPLGIYFVIVRACWLYWVNFWPMIAATAAVIVPSEAIVAIVLRITEPSGIVALDGQLYALPGTSQSVVPSIVLLVLQALFTLVATAVVYRLILGRYLGFETTLRQAFGAVLERLAPLIWLTVITTILMAIAFVLIIIPGIYVTVCFAVAVPALLVENQRGLQALTASRDLVRGHWWRTLAVFIATAAVIAVFILSVLVLLSGSGPNSVTGVIVLSAVLNGLALLLLAPFGTVVGSVLYVDLRVRAGSDTAALIAPDW